MKQSFISFLIASILIATSYGRLPEISLGTLKDAVLFRKLGTLDSLRDKGGKFSAFAITNLQNENYLKAVDQIDSKLSHCLDQDPNGSLMELSDGSSRATYATETGQFPSCFENLMNDMHAQYDHLDAVISNFLEKIMGTDLTYKISSDAKPQRIINAPHKDHVHLYKAQGQDKGHQTSTFMVPFHIDNGIFLLLTPFPGHGLQVKLSNGLIVDTGYLPVDSVLVLFGLGLSEWLLQGWEANPFFAVPHAVPSLFGTGREKRTVYARMKVASGEAVPLSPWTGAREPLRTFNDVFMRTVPYSTSRDSQLCTTDLDPWLRSTQEQCEDGSAYCWMSCLDVPEFCQDDSYRICINSEGRVCADNDMDTSCHWECTENCADNPNLGDNNTTLEPEFCVGMTDMFMMGFQTSGHGNKQCILLFFSSWVLDTPLKFGFGCVGVFLLGFSIELFIAFRRTITNDMSLKGIAYYLVVVSCFALNLLSGYFAMLVVMTYSVELFLCVSVGIVVGHAVFNVKTPVRESIDPCCASEQQETRKTSVVMFDQVMHTVTVKEDMEKTPNCHN